LPLLAFTESSLIELLSGSWRIIQKIIPIIIILFSILIGALERSLAAPDFSSVECPSECPLDEKSEKDVDPSTEFKEELATITNTIQIDPGEEQQSLKHQHFMKSENFRLTPMRPPNR